MSPTMSMLPARALPLTGSAPASVLLLVLMLFAVAKMRTWPARFVLFAIWVRFLLDAFALYTGKPLVGSFSLNAIGSIIVVLLGCLAVSLRYLRWTLLIPVYVLVAVMTLSSVVNGIPTAMIEQGTKFAYFTLIMIGCYQALREEETARFSAALLVAFLPPLAFVLVSVLFGVTKQGESDGSVSYIGGFYHESVFSVSVAGGLIAACFATRLNGFARWGFILTSIVAMLLANYRTTIIAMLPLLLYMFAAGPLGALRREGRPLAGAVAGLAALLLLASLNIDFGTRVQSVVNFAAKPTEFLRPTYSFTRDERSEASGRAYVWSQYYNAYRESDPLRKIAGHGPDTWETAFGVYAQNTILSYLYEFGALGALAAIAIWLVMLGPLLRAPRRQRLPLLLMHLGFAILNMSTMPFWQIEGLIMYGLICGYTIYYGQQARISRPRAAMPPPAEGNLQLIRPA
jgi:hypothetical protein